MTLMRSVSGMRGTVGGQPGQGLTPLDLVQFASAYAAWLTVNNLPRKVVIGRDGRVTGPPIQDIVTSTLRLSGCDVINLDLSTTPTVEMAVPYHKAGGGIILTASHNPAEWNALKFLNQKGEFISAEDGQWILKCIEESSFTYPDYKEMGSLTHDTGAIDRHIESILNLPYINAEQIKACKFTAIIDPVNSTGALALPPLLDALGVKSSLINGEISGLFAHNPEPLPKHLVELSNEVKSQNADIGISVDPDVDRLVMVCEDGSFLGEEYSLVAVSDFILSKKIGPTVSNLSSSRALTDLSNRYGAEHHQSAVGEVHVVNKMKEVNAVIGGEGNGGIIVPDLHYGRDALVGIAIILQLMCERKSTLSALKAGYPVYIMDKQKLALTPDMDADQLLAKVSDHWKNEGLKTNTTDGVKVDLDQGWAHLRKSNTEPIIRLYFEANDEETLAKYVAWVKSEIKSVQST